MWSENYTLGDGVVKMSKRKITARGILQGEHIECPVIITCEYSEFSADPVVYEIMPDMSYFSQYKDSIQRYNDRLSVRGETSEGKQILIPDFKRETLAMYSDFEHSLENPKQVVWTATADVFVEGQLGEFDAAEGEILCTLFTSPSPFANTGVMYQNYPDGQIKIENDRERRGIKWTMSVGEAECIDEYYYLTSEREGIDPAITQVRRSCILLRPTPREKVNLAELLINVQEEFDNTLWLMSFLARRRIIWYEGKAHFYSNESSYKFRKVFIRRKKWLGYIDERVSHRPLIDVDRLKDGLFQQLLSQFQSPEFKEIIHQTIIQLLMSYEQGYIENQYTSVYTGLECLVSGLGIDNSIGLLMPKGEFKKIRKRVKEVLTKELGSSDIVEAISEKIPELQRRSFVAQLLLQLQQHQIELETLWPNSSNSEAVENLRALIRRRNAYIHQASMKDSAQYHDDMLRIRYLLEIWILRLLKCPTDLLSAMAKPYFLSKRHV